MITIPTANTPIFGATDDLLKGVFDAYFKDRGVQVGTLYTEGMKPPILIARRERRSGAVNYSSGDDRFLRPVIFVVNTITDGIDADDTGDELQEAALHALRWAQQTQLVIPDGGSISSITNSSIPARVSDWATSTGVVQYASLPKGWVRYEAIYRMMVRPPPQHTITNRFLAPRK